MTVTALRFTRTAREGEATPEAALKLVLSTEPVVLPAEIGYDERWVWVGPDGEREPLEVVAVSVGDDLVVVSASPRIRGEERPAGLASPPRDPLLAQDLYRGDDVDLDVEVLRDSRGKRYNERRARNLSNQTLRGLREKGVPDGTRVSLTVVLPAELHDRVGDAARTRGVTVAQVVRDALTAQLGG
ncbi:MAG: hypothetical protein Q8R60_15230 [Mycobacteriales bacterium]|nr:hypothetical protein [Mycobacteriales bacterium]